MTVSSARVVVSNSPVALNSASPGGERLLVSNTTANLCDIGGSGVAAGAGYLLGANASVSFELDPGDLVYAVRTAGVDTTLSVLRT